jgi:DNA primase
MFFCFGAGCGASGDVFSFVRKWEGLPSFRAAVDFLARKTGLDPFRPTPETTQEWELERVIGDVTNEMVAYYAHKVGREAIDYLARRAIPTALVEKHRLGWADGGATAFLKATLGPLGPEAAVKAGLAFELRNVATWVAGAQTHRDLLERRVVFPCLRNFQAMFLSGRAIDPGVEPKYLHQKGRDVPLYNEDAITTEQVFVTEGPLDALSLEAWSYPAVALQGGARASALPKLRRARAVYLCLDADAAGQEATLRLAAGLRNGVKVVRLPPGMDPNDMLRKDARAMFDAAVTAAVDPLEFALDLAHGEAATQALTPLLTLLASYPHLDAEVYLAGAVASRLGLSARAVQALRHDLDERRAGNQQQCSACGSVLVAPERRRRGR